jgi:hypothetical protein
MQCGAPNDVGPAAGISLMMTIIFPLMMLVLTDN